MAMRNKYQFWWPHPVDVCCYGNMVHVCYTTGLKTIISALLKSMRMLAEVILLTLFCMMVFALFALQVYVGVLRQKCVSDIPAGTVLNDLEWMEYVKNESNWVVDDEPFVICGNASGAG